MTLHWWMHWFWITRTVAAATLLLFLVAAGTAVPLPPSTLHPEFQEFASPSASNLASVLPLGYQERSSSVPSGHPEETVSFEANPVWTSSPEIEEPFYPTTAPSGSLPHGGSSTEDIPGESLVISWPPEVHQNLNGFRVLPADSIPSDGDEASVESVGSADDKRSPNNINQDIFPVDEMIEPRALPLKSDSLVLSPGENQTIPTTNPDYREITPKILKNDSSQVIKEITSKDEQARSDNNLSIANVSAIDPINAASDSESSRSEYVPRLKTRDVRNISESELTSHGNSSSNSQIPHNGSSQTGLRPNIRTSKSIEFFPSQPIHSHLPSIRPTDPPSLTESAGRGEHIKNPSGADGHSSRLSEEVGDSDGKTVMDSTASPKQTDLESGGSINIKIRVSKGHVDSADRKTIPEDLEMSDSPYVPPNRSNSTIFVSQSHDKISKHSPPSVDNSSESISVDNKKTDFESGNSKLSSENHTKANVNVSDSTVNDSDVAISEKTSVGNKGKEMTPLASTLKPENGTSQNKKYINGTQILNQFNHSTGTSNEERNSSVTNDSKSSSTYPGGGAIQLSAVTPSNMTPASNRADFGRSASHNYAEDDDETTSTISVTPVSRVAVSPSSSSQRGLDAASITGIALGIVVFAGLTGAISFVLYRRRYLNKPQTLNDKCSNPDSSGYIDDSTLRENSEEMYSLDNDSFLNSLEAMTIQNYWTDNETCWRQTRP